MQGFWRKIRYFCPASSHCATSRRSSEGSGIWRRTDPDNIWRNLLNKTSSIWKKSWPVVPAVDAVLSRSNDFMKKNVKNLRDTVTKKPKKVPANWHRPNKVYVYVNRLREYDHIDIVLVNIILGNNLLYVFFKKLMMLKLRLYLLM